MNEQNLSLYRVFYAVAQTGNISKAANELYISQPAISKSISKLEENLNTTLFLRKSRGVTLTKEGELLLEYIRSAFASITEGEKTLQTIQEYGIGHLTFGVSTTLCKYLLLSYLEKFTKQYPHVRISIQCGSTSETLKLLEDKKVDIGLIGKPSQLKGVTYHTIQSVEDVFVATKEYLTHLLERKKINELNLYTSHQILASSNLMLLDKRNITRIYIDDYIHQNDILTKQILEVTSMDLLIEFAKTGLGIGCVIKEFVKEDIKNGTLLEIPLEVPIAPREVGFAYGKTGGMTEAMKKFIHFFALNT